MAKKHFPRSSFDASTFGCCFEFSAGCWSNGKTPGLQPGNRGSTPRRSTEAIDMTAGKEAEYGSSGRFAKPRDLRHVGSNPIPSARIRV